MREEEKRQSETNRKALFYIGLLERQMHFAYLDTKLVLPVHQNAARRWNF